ncbi:MAG: group II intron reverse transcriptase/maturase [Firmicutes bacterium]|nr:group II intron reverse transcriptase/maturase [Bacillota bacterium]
MAQQFVYPNTESELRQILDQLFLQTREAIKNGLVPRFKGLIEIISSEVTILTAVHNIKSNRGSKTPGTDGEIMQTGILEKDYQSIIQRVQKGIKNYQPKPIRRVHIPKPGKSEKRPIGIQAIIDRIIQECIRIVIEPILEAQFFAHSYGFRPMRDAKQALARVSNLVHRTSYHWIVEGDISKYFDTINHRCLIQKLWHMGIRDRRLLIIIKQMLKAGIMNEIIINKDGVSQGSLLSPLLANAYLDTFDQWVTREWEQKETKRKYSKDYGRIASLKRTKLKPVYLIRYADDWVLITNTKENAEKWKLRIAKYLRTRLKLKLSEEKTKLTNITKRPIHFVGFNIKFVAGKARQGFVVRIRPNPERLTDKIASIKREIRRIRFSPTKENAINQINLVNSKIRGIIQYYEAATQVYHDLAKQQYLLEKTSYNSLKRFGVRLIPANRTDNLGHIHPHYRKKLASIEHDGLNISITSLTFCSWKMAFPKNQSETPYTAEGREKYRDRIGRSPPLSRADKLLSEHLAERIAWGQTQSLYNFEYFMNRAYAFNRDKGKCRVCKNKLHVSDVEIHHIKPCLPLDKVNKVMNLASVCKGCHRKIHNNLDFSKLGKKTWNKIQIFREKLRITSSDNDGAPYAVKAARTV